MKRIWLFAGAVAAALTPPLRQSARTTRMQAQKAERAKQDDPRRRKTPELFDEVKGPGITLRQKPEVMAPAGGWPQLRAAVHNGADAVYFGLSTFSARARATNFDPGNELDEVIAYLRENEVKGYVALNTLAFDRELDEIERLLRRCSEAGVDAVIVQDVGVMALAREVAPELPIHASSLPGGAKEDVAAGLADDELEVELTRPLGVTVQEGANGRVLVQGCRAGGCAAAAGVAPGDEIIGVSAVFGAGVWRCEGAGLDRVEGLIRAREGSVRLRLRRGAGEPAAASDGLDEEDVDAGTFSAIFEDSSGEPSAADGPGAAPDGGALDTLVESILVADYAPPDA